MSDISAYKDPNLPAPIDLEQDAGSGFEDVKSTDLVLPFWKLLQSASSETKRSEPEYIKGAVEGLWLDSITKRLFRDIVVMPVKMVTHYIEWVKRSEGGGMVKNHGTNRGILENTHRDEKTGKDTLDNEHEIVTTANWFVLVISGKEINPTIADDEGTETELQARACITFQSTALKASRSWVSLAQSMRLRNKEGKPYTPPMFAMTYTLSCIGTRNDAGSWVLPVVKQAGWATDYPNAAVLINEAREYLKLANDIHMSVRPPQNDERPSRDNGSGGRGERAYATQRKPDDDSKLDDDIPF
jgi:hypothetical protein